MAHQTINLSGLLILVADSSAYMCMLIQSMLRGFGASKLLEVRDSLSLLQVLNAQKVDILLCDANLRPHDGLMVTRSIRRNPKNENRTVPILIMSSDTRDAAIKTARDVGANMVIMKPMSPASLYDRIAWIAFNQRPFVDTATYFGPDRRFKIEGFPNGVGRRKGDKPVEVAKESGPTLAQNDIDSLFTSAKTGQA